MTFKSGGIRKGIESLKYDSYKKRDDRMVIGNAVARLGLLPDEAIKATNEIFAAENRYAKAVELLGEMRAEKIRTQL